MKTIQHYLILFLLLPFFSQAQTIEMKANGEFWSTNITGLDDSSNDSTHPPTAPVIGESTRLMWIPSRSAFRAGTVSGSQWNKNNIGLFSFASGFNTYASGKYSTANGYYTTAYGVYSTSMGGYSTASGEYSTAMGHHTTASGIVSLATGFFTTASGTISTSLGYITRAGGRYSTAMGDSTTASGHSSTAMGGHTMASGDYSTTMGYHTTANKDYSIAIGFKTVASGTASTAMGDSTRANGDYSTAMGLETRASGKASAAMGNSTLASGDYATSMGRMTSAKGDHSFAMGYYTHAEGAYSTTIGYNLKANADHSTIIGKNVTLGGTATGSMYLADASRFLAISETEENKFFARFNKGYHLYTDGVLSVGVGLENGDNSWNTISDSTLKENFIPANTEDVLNSVSQIRIGTWNYKEQSPAQFRHWGVMAQDFFKHFGKDEYGTVGNDKSIATADFDGVAFAAIKGLEQRTRDLKSENEALKKKNEGQEKTIAELLIEIKELKKDRELFASEISLIKQQLGLNSPESRTSEE